MPKNACGYRDLSGPNFRLGCQSASCIRRGIGQRTSRSCRRRTRAPKISLTRNTPRPVLAGAAIGSAAGAAAGAALAWFVCAQNVIPMGLGPFVAAGPVFSALAGGGDRRRAGLGRGFAGGSLCARVHCQAVRGQNQAWRHSRLCPLRQSGVVRPGEEDP